MGRIKRIAIIISIFGITLIPVTANAQVLDLPDPGLTPDSQFYFLELLFEDIITAFTFDKVKRAERYARLAEERLVEARTVAVKGHGELAAKAVERYQINLGLALEKAKEARADGRDVEVFTDKTLEAATQRHLEVLRDVREQVSDEAKPAIDQAVEVSETAKTVREDNPLDTLPQDAQTEALEYLRRHTSPKPGTNPSVREDGWGR